MVSSTTLGRICVALTLVRIKVANHPSVLASLVDLCEGVQVIIVLVFGEKQDCFHAKEVA